MRNGNFLQSFLKKPSQLHSSYPTYEEWKPAKDMRKRIGMDSSYPTYEEWKLFWFRNLSRGSKCSYPTYEEWKLIRQLSDLIYIKFLSYL